jgi:uncharacterized damage-inducible protein DinB
VSGQLPAIVESDAPVPDRLRRWISYENDHNTEVGVIMNNHPGNLTREFGWSDMFVHPNDDPRSYSPSENTERAVLLDYLHYHRLTLQLKCADLDAESLARRSVPPSNLSLLGLVRHMARVEQIWFRIRMAGERVPVHYRTEDRPDMDFEDAVSDPAVVSDAWQTWQSEAEFAERFVAAADDLGMIGANGDALREVLVHMIEEYARHNGHADFLRERIDGRVGQ